MRARARDAYRVVRDQLLPVIAGRGSIALPDQAPVFAAPTSRAAGSQLALVVGPFAFDDWYATYGDTQAMRVALEWLEESGIPYDVACHPHNDFTGVNLHAVDPEQYTIIMYVCGPWRPADRDFFFSRFEHCVKIGVNVSLVGTSESDFDHLFARDLGEQHRPDVVFSPPRAPDHPLVGVFMVHEQPEYGARQQHDAVTSAVDGYFARGVAYPVELDTLHVGNRTSAKDAAQLEALVRRLDVTITSRLHGFVFSLRAGTPPIAIDPIVGGGKVTAQARAVDWPILIPAEETTADRIAAEVERCLTEDFTGRVDESLRRARAGVAEVRDLFVGSMSDLPQPADSPVGP